MSAHRKIMYWSNAYTPSTYSNALIPYSKKMRAIEVLKAGVIAERYMGYARCRICDVRLGALDLTSHGFVWPQRAEHYIEAHNVWTPDLDDLLTAAGATTPAP
jgi:hypothetical protein